MAQLRHPPEDLVNRIRAGDRGAEGDLVEQYQTGVRLMLLKKVRGSSHLADDLTQETFLIAINRIRKGEINKPEALAGFLRQTASNLAIAHFRKEQRYVHHSDGIIELQATPKEKMTENLEQEELQRILIDAVDELGVDRDRQLLKRFYLQDEDKAVICEDLALTPAHFDRVLYRARNRMRALLESNPELLGWVTGK